MDGIKITRHKLSLWEVTNEFFIEIDNDDIMQKAESMAFNFFLALFPGLLFFLNLLPYIPIDNLINEVLIFLESSLPNSFHLVIRESVVDILENPRKSLLSFGLFFALAASMNGVVSMMVAFNDCYNNAKEKRGFFQIRLVALLITTVLVGVLVLTITIMTVGENYIHYLEANTNLKPQLIVLLQIFRYFMLLLLFFIAISIIYYSAPSVKIRWHFFSHGAVIATVLIVLVSVGFFYYIDHFASYNKLYGSIGTFIGMLLWFYITSLLLLVGFEINASIDSIRHKGQLKNVKKIRLK
jgi:membrane protein